jgi:hypothetical protein
MFKVDVASRNLVFYNNDRRQSHSDHSCSTNASRIVPVRFIASGRNIIIKMVNPRRVPWSNERELRDLYGMIWDDFSDLEARAQAVARVSSKTLNRTHHNSNADSNAIFDIAVALRLFPLRTGSLHPPPLAPLPDAPTLPSNILSVQASLPSSPRTLSDQVYQRSRRPTPDGCACSTDVTPR